MEENLLIENHIEDIRLGWEVWNSIKQDYEMYIVFSKVSELITEKKHLFKYLEKSQKKVCVITDDNDTKDTRNIRIITVSTIELNALIKYYKFFKFSPKLYVVDTSIFSENIKKILSYFSAEEILFIGILKEEKIPCYE